MGFGEAVQKGISNVGNFEGRSSRPEFWWFALAAWVGYVVLQVIVSAVFRGGFGNFLFFVIWVLVWLAILSVSVRRLHDVGQSGWLVLIGFIPCIGLILIYFFVQPSQGDNQYGPAPAA
jgi:uncharacterized membrane protein YhaH (DUF805 family)